jgi:hypothetical protein
MPNVNDIYASPWLRATDLRGQIVPVQISKANAEQVRQRDGTTVTKIVLAFVGKQKRLILNKTQALAIAAALGDQTEDWPGAHIQLREGRAHNGKPTIVVMVANPPAPQPAPAAAPEPRVEEGRNGDGPSDDPLAEREAETGQQAEKPDS